MSVDRQNYIGFEHFVGLDRRAPEVLYRVLVKQLPGLGQKVRYYDSKDLLAADVAAGMQFDEIMQFTSVKGE